MAFTLAILRRDAIIVPFATFDGKRWEDYWPEPRKDIDIPINLRSVPGRWWGPFRPLDRWQIWTGTTQPGLVNVRQPDWLQTHCLKQVGLTTDYQPTQRPPGRDAQPFPKDGLAVAPPHPVEPIEILGPNSPERQVMADILPMAFAEREEAAVVRAQQEGSPVHPSNKELAALPITIEALYAYGTTRRIYFVEAVREYKQAGACAAVVFGSGWFARDSGRFTFANFDASVAPCNRTGLNYMLPLGAMSVSRGTYWIAQLSGWDHEEYAIVNIGARPLMLTLSVWGGGCS
jgi:hypothetical protein